LLAKIIDSNENNFLSVLSTSFVFTVTMTYLLTYLTSNNKLVLWPLFKFKRGEAVPNTYTKLLAHSPSPSPALATTTTTMTTTTTIATTSQKYQAKK